MKIKKKGNSFIAYRTEKGEKGASFAEVGSEIGRISITTGKYTGGTGALIELNQHLQEYLEPKEEKFQQLVDDVIEQIKKDIADGDVTAIDELLKFVPEKNLKGYLPEKL